ncbi:glycerophosphoryl diester phosphodiesterase [Nocardioides scoriae]|uniref:glycerophosphodiester phosphodiesterase n=1 Tax=Nocardioides scoriae TaxID=642780 RepID=A0A1H1RTL8_9ACTN|nr:glycerophosphodiester phosphodiesterase family protein [Nocardioides scoriae]SDS39024.1 glycerophosphoryl diester phosphodiesterase [Nocardioides scoriae]
MDSPLVIGHRGASGHRPEHTALAYRLAWRSGADSVEPDVVATRDGVLVCRHDLDLEKTTDVADRPEFAHLRREQVVDGARVTGWFVHDFDLAELRTLRARERWPRRRPTSARYDDQVGILTLAELLDLRAQESARLGRRLGLHVELKHGAHQARLGLPVDELLLDLLRERHLTSALSPVTVMAFETHLLKQLRARADLDLVQLVDAGVKLRRRGLHKLAGTVTGVGLHKDHVLRRDEQGRYDGPGAALDKAVAAGLDVLVWTLRSENRHLSTDLQVPGRGRTHGRADVEVERLLGLGVDGLLTDFPELAHGVRRARGLGVARPAQLA